ncbi:DMT family transporter (plasmid) [Ensifer adhaerens]|uniref:EamA family transporter n=1 Tax=Ensifer adhaerens TaxID=106592 RepID=UPI001CBCD474|nr:EamA family transporter [Ensifer adhaerens]MBZ7927353.1 DMT family transporter [Ensifer adhaerens]UAX98360.1 DMT family transporter [Ensifer adhaerens]UAY05743.1 DMT family transporter [Ensifer adhaerens]UAY13121.1 DMT family transporter [Ensifer adhaerens]
MVGECFAALSALCYSLADASIVRGGPTKKGSSGVLLSSLLTAIISSMLWISVGLPFGEFLDLPGKYAALGWFTLGGVLSTGLARSMAFKATEISGVANSAVHRRLIPAFSIVFSLIIFGSSVSNTEILGITLIVFGVYSSAIGLAKTPALEDRDRTFGIRQSANRGIMFGLFASVFYAGAYSARKLGMEACPDPAFGAFVGSLSGMIWCYAQRRLGTSTGEMTEATGGGASRWQFLAAACVSLGQLLQFFALRHTDMVIVALIGSLEMLVGPLLSSIVFRQERSFGKGNILAGLLSLAGLALIAARALTD